MRGLISCRSRRSVLGTPTKTGALQPECASAHTGVRARPCRTWTQADAHTSASRTTDSSRARGPVQVVHRELGAGEVCYPIGRDVPVEYDSGEVRLVVLLVSRTAWNALHPRIAFLAVLTAIHLPLRPVRVVLVVDGATLHRAAPGQRLCHTAALLLVGGARGQVHARVRRWLVRRAGALEHA